MRMKAHFCVSTVVLLCAFLSGCKTKDDATAVSKQLTATSTSLKSYYAALADAETETISLSELDVSISGIPFPADQRKDLEDTRAALQQREQMAEGLADLAASFSSLTASSAPDDVATSATALANELIKVKALPNKPPIPAAVGKAANLLLQIIRRRDEKKAAQAMDQTVAAIRDLFFLEKPDYDHITEFRLREAKVLSKRLINRNQVDPTALLDPALKPFNLTPLPANAATETTLKALALSRLDASSDQALHKARTASSGMLAALTEMSSRIHRLATGQHMPARGNPVTLKDVEFWLTQLS